MQLAFCLRQSPVCLRLNFVVSRYLNRMES